MAALTLSRADNFLHSFVQDLTPSSSPESAFNTLSFLTTTCTWQEGSQLPCERPVGPPSSMFQLWSNDVAPNSAHQRTLTMPRSQFPGHMQHHSQHHHHHELPLTPPAEPPVARSFVPSPVKMFSSQAQGNAPYYAQPNAVRQNFPTFLQNTSARPHLPGAHGNKDQQWWSLPQGNSTTSGHPFALSRQLVLGHQPQISALLQSTSKGLLSSTRQCRRCRCPNCQTTGNGGAALEFGKKRLHVCHIPDCGKVYKKTSHLTAHLRWHAGERPFVCNWLFCGKSFTRSDELQRHLRIHTGEKRFGCQQCGKRFMRSDHLTKHVKTHQIRKSRSSQLPHSGTDARLSNIKRE